jgi:hypothetical protein
MVTANSGARRAAEAIVERVGACSTYVPAVEKLILEHMEEGWIPVSERKPPVGKPVMWVWKGVVQNMLAIWDGENFIWPDEWEGDISQFDSIESSEVTHWWLPAPPETR